MAPTPPALTGAGPAWAEWHTKTHRGAPCRAGARVCTGPLRARLLALGSRALRRPSQGPNLWASQTSRPAAAAGGKALSGPASRASGWAGGARARAGRGGASVGGAGRGWAGAGHRKSWEARAVPGCPARRGLGQLPPSRWRGGERGPPACRSGQCGPVREGAGGRVSETQSAAATTKRTCWSPGPPPPLFPHSPNGTETGPATPPPLPLPRPPAPPPRPQPLPARPAAPQLIVSSGRSGPAGSPAPLRRGARSM